MQLHVIFCALNATKAQFLPQQTNKPRMIETDKYYIGRIIINTKETPENPNIPETY
jgi:hypothetical protein